MGNKNMGCLEKLNLDGIALEEWKGNRTDRHAYKEGGQEKDSFHLELVDFTWTCYKDLVHCHGSLTGDHRWCRAPVVKVSGVGNLVTKDELSRKQSRLCYNSIHLS